MIALLVPMIFLAAIALLTLGISFVCVEMVIRFIGRGLAQAAMSEAGAVASTDEPETASSAEAGRAFQPRLGELVIN